MANDLALRRQKTKTRIRGRISGTPERPRLTIYKSLKRIYVQAVDDTKGVTIAAASSLEKGLREVLTSGSNIAAAKAVGESIAARLKEAGITSVVFDRNGYVYHGRVKALADSARAAGLQF
jgi:large subunit ribosomal protein L18